MTTKSLNDLRLQVDTIEVSDETIQMTVGSGGDYATWEEAYAWIQGAPLDIHNTVYIKFLAGTHDWTAPSLSAANYILDRAGTYILHGEYFYEESIHETIINTNTNNVLFTANHDDTTYTETSNNPVNIYVRDIEFVSERITSLEALFGGRHVNYYISNTIAQNFYYLIESATNATMSDETVVIDCLLTQTDAASGTRINGLDISNCHSVMIYNTTFETTYEFHNRTCLDIDSAYLTIVDCTFTGYDEVMYDNYANVIISDGNVATNPDGDPVTWMSTYVDGKLGDSRGRFANGILYIDQSLAGDQEFLQNGYDDALSGSTFMHSQYTNAKIIDDRQITTKDFVHNLNGSNYIYSKGSGVTNYTARFTEENGLGEGSYVVGIEGDANRALYISQSSNNTSIYAYDGGTTGSATQYWNHTTSVKSGPFIQARMANGSGEFGGNFLDFWNNTSNVFKVDNQGSIDCNTISCGAINPDTDTQVTSGAIYINLDGYSHHDIEVTGDSVIQIPYNGAWMGTRIGQTGMITIWQGWTGGHNVTFSDGANEWWNFPAGDPTINTGANFINIFRYTIIGAYHVHMEFLTDVLRFDD